MAQPKRRKPGKREAERKPEEFTGFSEREKKVIHDLYQTLKKIVRKKRRNR